MKKKNTSAGKIAVVAGIVGALTAGAVVALNTKKGKEVAGKVKTKTVETAGKVKTKTVETAGKVKAKATETAGKVKAKFVKKADVEAVVEDVTEVELFEDELPEITPAEVEISAEEA